MPPSQPAKRLRRIRLALWGLVFSAAAMATYLGLRPLAPVSMPASTSYGTAFGGAFTLIGVDGKPVTEKALAGKPFAVFFGFTNCPDICPTALSNIAGWRRQLGVNAERIQIVFISVDPERDTPAVLRDYVVNFDYPIIALTGSPAQVRAAAKAYHVFYEKAPGKDRRYSVDHTASIFLMDANGQFVTTIDHSEHPAVALDKLQRLL